VLIPSRDLQTFGSFIFSHYQRFCFFCTRFLQFWFLYQGAPRQLLHASIYCQYIISDVDFKLNTVNLTELGVLQDTPLLSESGTGLTVNGTPLTSVQWITTAAEQWTASVADTSCTTAIHPSHSHDVRHIWQTPVTRRHFQWLSSLSRTHVTNSSRCSHRSILHLPTNHQQHKFTTRPITSQCTLD